MELIASKKDLIKIKESMLVLNSDRESIKH